MARVQINPALINWAIERSGRSTEELESKSQFTKLKDWQKGKLDPTMKQLEELARTTRTALGYFFLSNPPEDKLPIPDLRTVDDESPQKPSPDLLETVEAMQRRQAWMRDFLIEEGHNALPFVASTTEEDYCEEVATDMRGRLELDNRWAARSRNWEEALRRLRSKIEQAGIIVVFSGYVGTNTHRGFDVDEFRGFTLVDKYAPLIFVNNKDGKAAQMFTLAHELAHLWIGAEGVSNLWATQPVENNVEKFCNRVAAEFLIPAHLMKAGWPKARQKQYPFQYLARRYKVSEIVAARRALDLKCITKEEFFSFYEDYREQVEERLARQRKTEKGGGNFWNNAHVRIGDYFGSHVVRAVKEGRLLYREAYELTGLYGKTFDKFASHFEPGS